MGLGVRRLASPLAFAISLALVNGCQGIPIQGTSPAAGVSPAVSVDPGASPAAPSSAPSGVSASGASPIGTSATPTGDGSSAPAPLASPIVSADFGILAGEVFDVGQKSVPDGSTVTARSLSTERPYQATVTTIGGTYVMNQVPLDTQIELTATRPGWTRRTRVVVVRQFDRRKEARNIVNFGGRKNVDDVGAVAYFLANYPEIERVEPVDQDASLPSTELKFKITVSEPLDAANQRRLSSSFLIVPNNTEALGPGAGLPDLTASGPTADELAGLRGGADPLTNSAYRFTQNSGFLNGYTVSEFKWEADRQTATFLLQAPLKTGKDREAQYAFLLVQRDEDPVKDGEGNALGMSAAKKFGDTKRGDIVLNAIREPSLSLSELVLDEEKERWADSHLSYTTFSIAVDKVAPKLISVLARRNFQEDANKAIDRIEFTFSEPMIAYPNIASKGLLSLNNYILAAAPTEADMEKRKLSSGGSSTDVDAGAVFTTVREALKNTSGMRINANGASAGEFFNIRVSVKDPRVMILALPAGSLPLDADFVMIFVGSDSKATTASEDVVSDPAGNSVDATANVKVGPIF